MDDDGKEASWLDRGDGFPVFWGWPGVRESALQNLRSWYLKRQADNVSDCLLRAAEAALNRSEERKNIPIDQYVDSLAHDLAQFKD